MGNNAAFTIFEATVIGAYDLGKLDKALLSVLMEPHRGSDIDSGGRRGLKTKDGKSVEQVVIETWGLKFPVDDEDGEKTYEQFTRVTNKFDWR